MRVDFPDADQSCGWDSEDMGFIGSMVGFMGPDGVLIFPVVSIGIPIKCGLW